MAKVLAGAYLEEDNKIDNNSTFFFFNSKIKSNHENQTVVYAGYCHFIICLR